MLLVQVLFAWGLQCKARPWRRQCPHIGGRHDPGERCAVLRAGADLGRGRGFNSWASRLFLMLSMIKVLSGFCLHVGSLLAHVTFREIV